MATRSLIGKVNPDNTITAIYCHWDGYPEHNGKILVDSYNTEDRVNELLSRGDMSTLDTELDACEFYKDRGDLNTEAREYSTFDEFFDSGREIWAEFFYLFDQDFWSCWDIEKNLVPLKF